MVSLICITTLLVAIIPLFVNGEKTTQASYFRVHTTNNCSTTENILGAPISENGTIIIPDGGKMAYLSVYGLWSFKSCWNETSCSMPRIKVGSGGGVCDAYNLTTSGHTLQVTKYGINETIKEIYLYPQMNLQGTPQVIKGDQTLPNNVTVKSYYFTGNTSWSLKDPKGTETCLSPKWSTGHGLNITTESNVTINSVISIKLGGCIPKKNSVTRITTTMGPYLTVFLSFIYVIM